MSLCRFGNWAPPVERCTALTAITVMLPGSGECVIDNYLGLSHCDLTPELHLNTYKQYKSDLLLSEVPCLKYLTTMFI